MRMGSGQACSLNSACIARLSPTPRSPIRGRDSLWIVAGGASRLRPLAVEEQFGLPPRLGLLACPRVSCLTLPYRSRSNSVSRLGVRVSEPSLVLLSLLSLSHPYSRPASGGPCRKVSHTLPFGVVINLGRFYWLWFSIWITLGAKSDRGKFLFRCFFTTFSAY